MTLINRMAFLMKTATFTKQQGVHSLLRHLCAFWALALCLNLFCPPVQAQLSITNFTGTSLTLSNAHGPGSYRIEYSTNLTRPWLELVTRTNAGSQVTVDLPELPPENTVLLRAVWTDPPAPNPIGRWNYHGYNEQGSLVVTGVLNITATAPIAGQLDLEQVAVPLPEHLQGEHNLSGGDVNQNQVNLIVQNYNFTIRGQIVNDEFYGHWSRFFPGISFPTPTPGRFYGGTFRATRAP